VSSMLMLSDVLSVDMDPRWSYKAASVMWECVDAGEGSGFSFVNGLCSP